MDKKAIENKSHVRICENCGKHFLVVGQRNKNPLYCPICRKERHKKAEKEKREKLSIEQAEQRKKPLELFEKELLSWKVIDLSGIKPTSGRTLYVIGNGFDLMHGVQSSYYSFRDSMRKDDWIRDILEVYLTPEDIWADFEDSLAYHNVQLMANRGEIASLLDDFEAYEEDSPVANFCLAVDWAVEPMRQMAYELPKTFRKWVNKLHVQTEDRPLKGLFVKGKVLNFNYTEFVEDLYGVPDDDVCYIHGSRKRIKGKREEELILGHRPGASADGCGLNERDRKAKTYRQALIDLAQERVLDAITDYDKDLTKNSKDIIKKHDAFFSSLKGTKDIVVIGHSYSEVDADYFKKIIEEVGRDNLRWYCGVYGLRDLANLTCLMEYLNIDKDDVTLFRTDTIRVNIIQKPKEEKNIQPVKEKVLAVSRDGKWKAKKRQALLSIENPEKEDYYQLILPSEIRKAFFSSSNKHLFVIDKESRVFVFSFEKRNASLLAN